MPRYIKDISAGSQVWVYETYGEPQTARPVSYIYLGQDENGKARLLRELLVTKRKYNDTTVSDYGVSGVDAWLNDEQDGFLARLDTSTKSALVNTSICCTQYTGSTAAYPTIDRKVFLLSIKEVGGGGNETGTSFLPALKVFYNGASDSEARIAREVSGGDGVYWWLRTASSATQVRSLTTGGSIIPGSVTSTNGVRPCLSFDPDTPVTPSDAPEIFLLPDSHQTYWPIYADINLGVSARRPIRGLLTVPHTLTGSLSLKVCNNYNDAVPTWVDCENNGVAVFGTTKTAASWAIGLRVQGQAMAHNQGIYEPALLAECEEGAQ